MLLVVVALGHAPGTLVLPEQLVDGGNGCRNALNIDGILVGVVSSLLEDVQITG
jgi:hypothetical protein